MNEFTTINATEAVEGVPVVPAGINRNYVRGDFAPSHTIAVVGAGASGVAVVKAIVEKFTNDEGCQRIPLTIVWLDKKDPENFGPGTAYLDHESTYDLNVPAKQMSIHEDNPTHFVKWLDYNYPNQYDKDSFVPRSVYAQYLRASVQRIIKKSGAQKITIVPQCGDVEDIVANGQFKVYTGPKSYTSVDQVVLAIGHMPGDDPFQGALKGQDNYFQILDEEAHEDAIDCVPRGIGSRDKEVLIVGFGSTAVDRIRLLDHAGYQGKITIITRHALEPWANNPDCDDKEGYEVGMTVHDLMKLAAQYTTYDNRAKKAAIENFVGLLKDEAQRAYSQGFGPQNFLYSEEFCSLLTDKSLQNANAQFCIEAQKMVALFKANPTPPIDARLINKYRGDGRLNVVVGEIINPPTVEDGRVHVSLQPHEGQSIDKRFDLVFNGSTYTRDFKNHPLLDKLFNRKGLGRIDRELGVMERNSRGQQICNPGIYVVGPAASATWGIETFRKQASQTACDIIKHMKERRPAAHINGNGGYIGRGRTPEQ